LDSNTPVRISEAVVSRSLRDRVVVLDARTGRYFQLQNAAAAIWQNLENGAESIPALADRVAAGVCTPASIQPDVAAFVDSAIEQGLLERGPEFGAGESSVNGRPLRVGRSRLTRGDLEPLRREFARQHYVRLPQLIDARVRDLVATLIDQGEFVDRAHQGIGTELCLVPGIATATLQLLFNDPDLLDAISYIADCAHVGCFDGRVYRMSASAGHYDSWHSDAGEDRLVAVSVNFGRERYEGGVLEIRGAASPEPIEQVPNPAYGDAVMFRISPALRHRVSAVSGTVPRTAYAGWFKSTPDFLDLFFGSLPND
jgi:hypothetical protein